MGARDNYVSCEECGSLLIEDPKGRQTCKLCGWTKSDPTLDHKGIPSYIG